MIRKIRDTIYHQPSARSWIRPCPVAMIIVAAHVLVGGSARFARKRFTQVTFQSAMVSLSLTSIGQRRSNCRANNDTSGTKLIALMRARIVLIVAAYAAKDT